MAEGEVVIRRLVSSARTTWLSVGAAVVGAVAVAGWGLATQTGTNRVMAAGVAVAVVVAVVLVAWRRTWVDTGAGTISHSVARLRTRTVAWADASTLDLESNRAGQLHLRARGEAGTVRATVLAIDVGGDRSMEPDQLRLLAAEIARWAPERARLADTLRSQADHVAAGGALRESPLARRL